jgi:hypothetical protein
MTGAFGLPGRLARHDRIAAGQAPASDIASQNCPQPGRRWDKKQAAFELVGPALVLNSRSR